MVPNVCYEVRSNRFITTVARLTTRAHKTQQLCRCHMEEGRLITDQTTFSIKSWLGYGRQAVQIQVAQWRDCTTTGAESSVLLLQKDTMS